MSQSGSGNGETQRQATGFVILDERGFPATHDHRLPVYWYRKTAVRHMDNLAGESVVKVTLTYEVSDA